MDSSSSGQAGFIAILLGLLVLGGGIGAMSMIGGGGTDGGAGGDGSVSDDGLTDEPVVPVTDEPETPTTDESTTDEPTETPGEGGGSGSGGGEAKKVKVAILPHSAKATFNGGGEKIECSGTADCMLKENTSYDYEASGELFVTESGKIKTDKTVAICLGLDWSPYSIEEFKELGKIKGNCANGKGNNIYDILAEVFNTPEAEETGNLWEE